MEQYPVPQFIEKEGKIIFFLTFRQFFWLVGGGAVCLVLYWVLPFALFVVLALVVMMVVGGAAFVKVNNVSMLTLLIQALGFSLASKNYVWKKKDAPYPFKVRARIKVPDIVQAPAPKVQESKLKEIKKAVEFKK